MERGSAEHTHELHSHRDLPSFPTRRSSGLVGASRPHLDARPAARGQRHPRRRRRDRRVVVVDGEGVGRAHARTPLTPRSTLFPYTTLFRSRGCVATPSRCTAGRPRPASSATPPTRSPSRGCRWRGGRQSTRTNSTHTEIYPLSLHDALPVSWVRRDPISMHGRPPAASVIRDAADAIAESWL